MNGTTIQALKGLQGRAKTGMVFSATQGYWLRFERWKMLHKGIEDAIELLTNADLASGLANPYQPPSHLQAAWAALPVDIDNLTMTNVVDLCRAKGVGVAENRVTKTYLEFIEKLVHDEAISGLTDINDEQPLDRVDGHDGTGEFHASLPNATQGLIVPAGALQQEGGAA